MGHRRRPGEERLLQPDPREAQTRADLPPEIGEIGRAQDLRSLIRLGLSTTRGSYRSLVRLFNMPEEDYKRFLNFLASHDCRADFREFRNGVPDLKQRRDPVLPGLQPKVPGTQVSA